MSATRELIRSGSPSWGAPEAKRIAAELGELERGQFRHPGDAETRLPDHLVSGATRRNRRRMKEARALYDLERSRERTQKLERQSMATGNRMHNPAGVKRLPLHEGRKARAIARDRNRALQVSSGSRDDVLMNARSVHGFPTTN